MANQAPSGLQLISDNTGYNYIQGSGGKVIYEGRIPTADITAGNTRVVSIKEGDSLTVAGVLTATGTIQNIDSSGAPIGALINISGSIFISPSLGTKIYSVTCLTGSLNISARDGALAFSKSSSNPSSSLDAFKKLNVTPVGFNYYSLLSDQYYNMAGGNTSRPINLQYIADTGAKMVRIATSAFGADDYLSRVHNTSVMPSKVDDSNLRTTFKTACDIYMNALSQYGLIGMHCILFGQATVPSIFNETLVQAYGDLNSKTTVYAKSMMTWFVSRYKDHPALGVMSIGNEYVTDVDNPLAPTTAQLSLWFAEVANAARTAKPGILVTANITMPLMSIQRTRESPEDFLIRVRKLNAGLDMYCVHVYPYYSYTGHNGLDSGTIPNASYNTFGFESIEAMMQGLHDISRIDNKALIVGEWGVDTNTETSDNTSIHYSTRKKWRFASAVVPYADCALYWNVQLESIAAASNQSVWAIDPQGTTQRANDFMKVAKAFNGTKLSPRGIGAALPGRLHNIRPAYMMRSQNRGTNINLKFTSTAAHQSSTGYAAMWWGSIEDFLLNAEVLIDFRNAGATAGFAILGVLSNNNRAFYSDSRDASGSVGNTLNVLPDLTIGDKYHFTYIFKQYNSNGTITGATEVWLNGIYLLTVPGSGTRFPASIPVGTTCYVMCNSGNGVPMKMQDFALFSSVTPEDIWSHMKGEVSSKALLHVRGLPDGSIVDVSKNATPLVVSNITVTTEK